MEARYLLAVLCDEAVATFSLQNSKADSLPSELEESGFLLETIDWSGRDQGLPIVRTPAGAAPSINDLDPSGAGFSRGEYWAFTVSCDTAVDEIQFSNLSAGAVAMVFVDELLYYQVTAADLIDGSWNPDLGLAVGAGQQVRMEAGGPSDAPLWQIAGITFDKDAAPPSAGGPGDRVVVDPQPAEGYRFEIGYGRFDLTAETLSDGSTRAVVVAKTGMLLPQDNIYVAELALVEEGRISERQEVAILPVGGTYLDEFISGRSLLARQKVQQSLRATSEEYTRALESGFERAGATIDTSQTTDLAQQHEQTARQAWEVVGTYGPIREEAISDLFASAQQLIDLLEGQRDGMGHAANSDVLGPVGLLIREAANLVGAQYDEWPVRR